MSRRDLSLPSNLLAEPFTTERLTAAGLSPAAIRRRAVRRIAPRVYAATEPSLADSVRAQLMTLPGDVIVEGVTALQLYGVDIGDPHPLRFCSPAGRDIRRLGIRVRRVRRVPTHHGRLATPLGALSSAAIDLDLVDLVVAGDWLVRKHLTTAAEVRARLAGAYGPHARKEREAGALVRDRAESPQESRLRLLLILAGLPEPDCNVDIGDEHFFIARVDLAFLRWKILLEYEGDQHRTSRRQWLRDIDRAEWLGEKGMSSSG